MIKNLIIIGNGFDLAHDLKTSYSDFINHLINEKINTPESYDDLFLYPIQFNTVERVLESFKAKYMSSPPLKNKFFQLILNEHALKNWCDIEELYFKQLINIEESKLFKSVEDLNSDFEVIKKYLEKYLSEEQKRFSKIDSYSSFFTKFNSKSTLILNFNYTSTLQNYLSSFQGEIINIHGELYSDENPIVFGFAADYKDTRELSNKGISYIKNIKRHSYKSANNYDNFKDFFEKNSNSKIEVLLLGHSCGISDKLILNEIFNSDKVKKIRLFYYQNRDHYFECQHNIDQIMNDDKNFERLVNFPKSIFMPQKRDSQNKEFIEKIEAVKESQPQEKQIDAY